MGQQVKKVLIAVYHQGNIRPELTQMLMQMVNSSTCNFKVIFPQLKPYVHAVNIMMQQTLRDGFDYLLMIDNDNPPRRNPLELVELDKDIIGCPTPQWNNSDPNFPIYKVAMDRVADGYREHKEQEGLQEVDAVGSGCVLYSKAVIEACYPFERVWEDGVAVEGADFNFCTKAKEKGFTVWAHYDYLCSHFKEIDLLEVLKLYGIWRRQLNID